MTTSPLRHRNSMKTYTITYIDNQGKFHTYELKAKNRNQAVVIFIQDFPQYKNRIRGIS